jgi:hypothetical protein
MWWSAAAAALTVAGVAGGWYLRSRSEVPAPSAVTARVSSRVELTANVDLRKHTVVRSQEKQPELEPVSLPRGRVKATIQLPPGFEPGEYKIQVLDVDLRSRTSATGTGEFRDYVTTVEATLDISVLSPGVVAVGRPTAGRGLAAVPGGVR